MKGAGFRSLYDISYEQGFFEVMNEDQSLEDIDEPHNQLSGYLDEAKRLLDTAVETNTVSRSSRLYPKSRIYESGLTLVLD